MKRVLFFTTFLSLNSFSNGLSGTGGFNNSTAMDNFPKDYFAITQELTDNEDYPKLDWGDNGPTNPWILNNQDKASVVQSYDKGVRMLLENIPDSNVKDGLNHYLDIINSKSYGDDIGVGAGNSGIVAFNRNTLKSNPCFSQLAEAFYTDLNNADRENFKDRNFDNETIRGRPNLSVESGKPPFEHLKPGWLYDKALKYSGGDPNLAFRLLSICGHDDTAHGPINYQIDNVTPKKVRPKEDYVEVLDRQISDQYLMLEQSDKAYKKYLKDKSSGLGLSFVQYPENYNHKEAMRRQRDYIEQIKIFRDKVDSGKVKAGEKVRIRRNIECPAQNSQIYLSKALGEDADLSDEFKDKIAFIQAPNKGKSVLPSKNYHIMGSAFMACQLVSKGISPKMATTIQKMAAWAYRTIRLNSLIKNDLSKYEEINKKYNEYVEKFKEENSERVRTPRGYRKILKKRPPSLVDWLHAAGPEVIGLTEYSINKVNLKDKNSIRKWLVKYDSAKVISDMTLGGGEVFGQSIPHTNLSLNFIGDPIEKHINTRKKEAMSSGKKRRGSTSNFGWDKDRYNDAKDKAMTYLIDWEWTTSQHETGANFASKKCKKRPIDYKPDHGACEVLSDAPGIVCNIDYYNPQSHNGSLMGGGMMIHGPTAPVTQVATELEKVSEKMEEQYLADEIKFDAGPSGLKVNGLY